MKLALLRSACGILAGSIALHLPLGAQQPTTPASAPVQMETITVTGREESLVGVATTSSEGVVGATELQRRPLLRPGEIVETIPGVIVTQHAGGGKANQFFLRGFNLDHGTDLATSIEGMPVNMVTHAH